MATVNEKIRQEITDKIIKAMEIDLMPWRLPWLGMKNVGHPCNISNRNYGGINVLLTQLTSLYHDWKSRYWGTMGQWSQMGAYIKRRPEGVDSWGTRIVYYNFMDKEEKKDNGDVKKKKIPFMRGFVVFNVEQVEAPNVDLLVAKPLVELNRIAKKALGVTYPEGSNLTMIAEAISDTVDAKLERYRAQAQVGNTEPDYAPAEALIVATGVEIIPNSNKAFYRMGDDKIRLPSKKSFLSMTDYYETAFHELVHWAMVPKRLDLMRDTTYAFNELVAEIGACFLAAELNVPLAKEMLPQNQAYLKGWLKQMGDDKKFIFEASTVASKVCDFLLKNVRAEQDTADEGEGEDLQRAA